MKTILLLGEMPLRGRVLGFSMRLLLGLIVLGHSLQGAVTNRWEKEVLQHEAKDRVQFPGKGGVLFVGSSSVRKWTTLSEDFPGVAVVGRGIGGCTMADVNFYLERLVLPYEPKVIFVYAGDNDLAAGVSPDAILEGFQEFRARVHSRLPDTRIEFLSVKPSKARWNLIEKIKETNAKVEAYTKTDRRLGYVDLFSAMLPSGGELDAGWFESDGLHVNREGYRKWAKVIRQHLEPEMVKP